MNDKPCSTCANYDPILLAGNKPTGRGWCAAYSTYPSPGTTTRVVPSGAKRAAEGESAKPKIVDAREVVRACDRHVEVATKKVKR